MECYYCGYEIKKCDINKTKHNGYFWHSSCLGFFMIGKKKTEELLRVVKKGGNGDDDDTKVD